MKKYLKCKIPSLFSIDEIYVMEHRNPNGKFNKDVDCHDFWEITYIEKGQSECMIDKKLLVLPENSILFLPPNAKHFFTQDENTKIFCIGFVSNSKYLKPLAYNYYKLSPGQKETITNIINEHYSCFRLNNNEQLLPKKHQPFGSSQTIVLLLQYFIIQSLRFHDTHIAKINVSTLDVDTHIFITNQIQQYCLDHIREKLRLSDIASFVNFSQSQICASFKKVTGESIFSYINNLKIEEAKKLLSETTLPIKSIALNLSFSDEKYFNTFFKKKVGLAPSLFRQKNKTVNAKRAK